MGREARCTCRWGDREGTVTALLESGELIVRGAIRARAALPDIEHVRACGEELEFIVAGERIALGLGAAAARRWADAIVAPRPALAAKFGITSSTRLHVTGQIDDAVLIDALAIAGGRETSASAADLAIVRTDDINTIVTWLETMQFETRIPPAWFVYVKGRAAPLGESAIRACLRQAGFIDTKVAAVSERLTALRFIRKR